MRANHKVSVGSSYGSPYSKYKPNRHLVGTWGNRQGGQTQHGKRVVLHVCHGRPLTWHLQPPKAGARREGVRERKCCFLLAMRRFSDAIHLYFTVLRSDFARWV